MDALEAERAAHAATRLERDDFKRALDYLMSDTGVDHDAVVKHLRGKGPDPFHEACEARIGELNRALRHARDVLARIVPDRDGVSVASLAECAELLIATERVAHAATLALLDEVRGDMNRLVSTERAGRERAVAEAAAMREALAFYADYRNYLTSHGKAAPATSDIGTRARAALATDAGSALLASHRAEVERLQRSIEGFVGVVEERDAARAEVEAVQLALEEAGVDAYKADGSRGRVEYPEIPDAERVRMLARERDAARAELAAEKERHAYAERRLAEQAQSAESREGVSFALVEHRVPLAARDVVGVEEPRVPVPPLRLSGEKPRLFPPPWPPAESDEEREAEDATFAAEPTAVTREREAGRPFPRCGATMTGDQEETYVCGLNRGHIGEHHSADGCASWTDAEHPPIHTAADPDAHARGVREGRAAEREWRLRAEAMLDQFAIVAEHTGVPLAMIDRGFREFVAKAARRLLRQSDEADREGAARREAGE